MKNFIKRNKYLFAFLMLAAVSAYSLIQVQSLEKDRAKVLERVRIERSNDLLASAAQGAVLICNAANESILGVRKVIVGSYESARRTTRKLTIEGALTFPQGKLVTKDAFTSSKQYLKDLPYRNCQLVADQYTRQITDVSQAKKIADIKASVIETKKILAREDPKLIRQPTKP